MFTGLQAGHTTPSITLPLGTRVRMDADSCTLTVLESAVE
jgi:muramoyltetrapeptide carboxypeptidase LdcA involved in peptidoglycan recycling